MLRRLAGFFIAGTATQLVAILAGIVQARVLGPDGKSVLAYAALGLSFLLTATDGFTSVILVQAGRDKCSARVVHAAFVRIVAMLGVPTALLVLGLAAVLPSQRPLAGAALVIPFALYLQGTRGLLLAAGKSRAVIFQDALNSIIFGVVLMPLLIFAHLTAYGALALWVSAWIGSAAYAFRACQGLERTGVAPAEAAVRNASIEQLRLGLKNGAATLVGFINLRIDIFLVSLVFEARDLGIYMLAVATGELLWSVSLPLAYANMDRIAGAPFDQAASLVTRLTRNMLAVQIFLALLLSAIGPVLINAVYGSRFAPSGLILQLLLPGIAIYAARTLMGYFILVRIGRPMLLVLAQGSSAVACAAISLIMFRWFGIAGAAAATSVTYCLVVPAFAIIFCRATGVSWRELLIPTREDIGWYGGQLARRFQAS
jgi:O-antigen/teichoic acid export membrane protein